MGKFSANKYFERPLFLFFLIALLWTDSIWILLIPKVELALGLHLPAWSAWIGLMGPGLAAIFCSLIFRDGVKKLLGRLIQWRAPWILYPAILFGTLCYYLAAYGLNLLVSPQFSGQGLLARMDSYSTPLFHLPPFFGLIETSLIYGLCEELGWRGYALPRLLAFASPFWATFILNIFITIWHLPLIAISGHELTFPVCAQFFLHCLLISLLLTWIYLAANRSIFVTGLFHGTLNFIGSIFPETNAYFEQGHNLPSNLLLAFFVFCFLVPNFHKTSHTPSPGKF